MFNRKQLFRRVSIVGVGLMGASFGLSLKKRGLAQVVVGIGRSNESLQKAKEIGAIDEYTTDLAKGINGAELIVLATPVNTILDTIEWMGINHKRGCIVTDLGSTKASIVERAEKVLHHSVLFVGSHPLVGSQKRGPSNANGDLYDGGTCIMTPTDKTNRLAKEKMRHCWMQLGMNVKFMAPTEHDEVMAFVSHLPHMVSFALMKSIPEAMIEMGAAGLKDTTRIAASDPEVWRDIAVNNSKMLVKALDETTRNLAIIRRSIVSKDAAGLTDIFKQSKQKREMLDKSHGM